MSKEFDGYEQAGILEQAVNRMLNKYPPEEAEYAREWLAFCRTLVTGLQLIEATALRSLYEPEHIWRREGGT